MYECNGLGVVQHYLFILLWGFALIREYFDSAV